MVFLNIFRNYLKGKRCIPFGDGLLVHLTDEDHFIPDVMVVCGRNKIKKNDGWCHRVVDRLKFLPKEKMLMKVPTTAI